MSVSMCGNSVRLRCGRSSTARPPSHIRSGLVGDLHLDRHPQRIRWKADPGAGDRHCLSRIAHDRDTDQIVIADDAVGRIELDPAGAGEINAQPCMGRAAACAPAAALLRNIEVARDEMRRQPELTRRLHHQDRKIAAAAAAQPQRPDRVLDAALLARDIGQVLVDRMGH